VGQLNTAPVAGRGAPRKSKCCQCVTARFGKLVFIVSRCGVGAAGGVSRRLRGENGLHAGCRHAPTCRMPIGFLPVAAILAFFVATIMASDAAEFSGLVKSVIDGDDIELCADGGSCRDIRLCGIDAPEVECGRSYDVAREALRALVFGKRVHCIQVGGGTPCDGRSKSTNRGRIVAQCFVDETDVAAVLVERGVACDWKRFSGGHYSRNGKGRLCPPDHRRTCSAVP
jgi:micrococcal nuclease